MGYGDGIAINTGKIGEAEADLFLINNGFICVKPEGRDYGIDRIVSLPDNPCRVAKIQIKGRSQVKHPRWFSVPVTPAQLRDSYANGQDLNELWKAKIDMVDFWILVSKPLNEIWIFPSTIIHQIAEANFKVYYTRKDNNFSQIFTTKTGKIAKKQKELNLNIFDEEDTPLYEKYVNYKNNSLPIRNFINRKSIILFTMTFS